MDRKIEYQQIRIIFEFVSQFKIFFNILICSEENPCTPEGNKFLKRSSGNMEEANGSIKSASDEGSNDKENSKEYGLQNCKP